MNKIKISKVETDLLDYLRDEVLTTRGKIIRYERSLKRMEKLSEEEGVVFDIQPTLDYISTYKFRLMWLQGQINQIKELNNLNK